MSVLDYAIRIIKATMKNHSNESFFPYFFIVGAGISFYNAYQQMIDKILTFLEL